MCVSNQASCCSSVTPTESTTSCRSATCCLAARSLDPLRHEGARHPWQGAQHRRSRTPLPSAMKNAHSVANRIDHEHEEVRAKKLFSQPLASCRPASQQSAVASGSPGRVWRQTWQRIGRPFLRCKCGTRVSKLVGQGGCRQRACGTRWLPAAVSGERRARNNSVPRGRSAKQTKCVCFVCCVSFVAPRAPGYLSVGSR